MPILTEADQYILKAATRSNGGFHTATEWYFNWKPLPYQYRFHQLPNSNVSFVAGIASGKTTTVAASYLIDCLTIPYFKALNTSITATQAELAFDMIMSWVEGNPKLEHLIDDVSLRPYPTITFKNFSTFEFRTAGKDAKFIRGHEYDRINYDECGLDYEGNTIKVLRGRLRGTRPDGSIRMARLDTITSPTDAPWLKERFDRGWKDSPIYDPVHYLSMRVATYDNTRLTREQIELMEAEYPPEMIDVELNGFFPDFGYGFFPQNHIMACTDQSMNDALEEALHPEVGNPKPGYVIEESPRHGITKFELPADPRRMYIMGGDPGTDGPPKRNAGVVSVWDVTEKPYKNVYLHWTSGRGSYMPFIYSYKYAIDKYAPVFRGIDATGTQMAIDELAFENAGIELNRMSFQRDKNAMLNSLSIVITNHDLKMPLIKGNNTQLSQYALDMDDKIPQDIVMCQAECAFLARYAPSEPLQNTVTSAKNNCYNRSRRVIGGGRRR